MAKSTGIVLTAGGVAFVNEFMQTKTPNFRIPIATLALALVFDGIEKISEPAAVGLASMFLITALLAPINGEAPVTRLLRSVGRS
jgi:hypothetical protein